MYTVTRTGSARQIGAEIRAIAATQVPLVTAKALTFTIQRAQKDIVDAMPSVFAGGATRYTLGGTRIETATPQKLSARVAVKDQASSGANLPDNYLFPEVFGGARKEKRFERALRYAGILKAGERAIIGRDAPVDAYGNLPRREIEAILGATNARFAGTRKKKVKARARKSPYFAAQLGKVSGVFRRQADGSTLPIVIFTARQPQYRQKLDFEGIARTAAERDFQAIFNRLLLKAVRP